MFCLIHPIFLSDSELGEQEVRSLVSGQNVGYYFSIF